MTQKTASRLYPNDIDRINKFVEQGKKQHEFYAKRKIIESKLKADVADKYNIDLLDWKEFFGEYDLSLSSVPKEKLVQFERIYKKLANELVYDEQSANAFSKSKKSGKTFKQAAIEYTQRTHRGDCDMFAYTLNDELNKIGINNWLLCMGNKHKEADGHMANLIEIDKGKLVVADLVLDTKSITSNHEKKSIPTPYYEYNRYINNKRPGKNEYPIIGIIGPTFEHQQATEDLSLLKNFRETYAKIQEDPMEFLETQVESLETSIKIFEMYKGVAESPASLEKTQALIVRKRADLLKAQATLQKYSAKQGNPTKKDKPIKSDDTKSKTQIQMVEHKTLTQEQPDDLRIKIRESQLECHETYEFLDEMRRKIKATPLASLEMQIECSRAKLEYSKRSLECSELQAKGKLPPKNIELIILADKKNLLTTQTELQELLSKQAAEKTGETPAKKPEKTTERKPAAEREPAAERKPAPEREPAPDKQPDGIQKNIRKPSDNLREIKYLETRVKYFEMRIKYLEEPADIESNAAQLREVQAKLQELLAKQPAEKTGETPAKKPEKTTERKPAPAKKAGD